MCFRKQKTQEVPHHCCQHSTAICRKHQVHQSKASSSYPHNVVFCLGFFLSHITFQNDSESDTDWYRQRTTVETSSVIKRIMKDNEKYMHHRILPPPFLFCHLFNKSQALPCPLLYLHACTALYDIGGTQNQCRTEYLYFSNNKRQMFLWKLRQPFQRDLVLPQ